MKPLILIAALLVGGWDNPFDYHLRAGAIPPGRAFAVPVEPSFTVSPAVAASIPIAKEARQ